jgi:hypothetical protein
MVDTAFKGEGRFPRSAKMSKDHQLQDLLDELNAYIDNRPPMGSPEYLRFTEALGELLAHSEAIDALRLTPEGDVVGWEIDHVLGRIDRETTPIVERSAVRALAHECAKRDGARSKP